MNAVLSILAASFAGPASWPTLLRLRRLPGDRCAKRVRFGRLAWSFGAVVWRGLARVAGVDEGSAA
jgi:hypothetical protein